MAILACQHELKRQNDESLKQDKYTFDLRREMYYQASTTDVLNAPQINCFGLIKNAGKNIYELEVIALYM